MDKYGLFFPMRPANNKAPTEVAEDDAKMERLPCVLHAFAPLTTRCDHGRMGMRTARRAVSRARQRRVVFFYNNKAGRNRSSASLLLLAKLVVAL
jgi:hypothetical protein